MVNGNLDKNNNTRCNFDGDDSCGPNVNTQWCMEFICYQQTYNDNSSGCMPQKFYNSCLNYSISSYSFHGNYLFLEVVVQQVF